MQIKLSGTEGTLFLRPTGQSKEYLLDMIALDNYNTHRRSHQHGFLDYMPDVRTFHRLKKENFSTITLGLRGLGGQLLRESHKSERSVQMIIVLEFRSSV